MVRGWVLGVLAFPPVVSAADAPPAVAVGKNVQVSAPLAQTRHHETSICADPRDPKKLLAGVMYSDAEHFIYNTVYYASADAGRSWQKSLDLHYSADPACAYSWDGRVYATAMGFRSPGYYKDLVVHRSANGGLSWEGRYQIQSTYSLDRQWIAVAPPTAPDSGKVYVNASEFAFPVVGHGRRLNNNLVFTSTDRGITFPQVEAIAHPSQSIALHNGNGTALSDGTYLFSLGLWGDGLHSRDGTIKPAAVPEGQQSNPLEIYVVRSEDGADSLQPAVRVGEGLAGWPGDERIYTDHIPAIATDLSDGPFKDRVYLVWADLKEGGRSQPFFSMSSDRGLTWAVPRTLDGAHMFDPKQAAKGPHNVNPVIAVNKEGVVGVLWMDRRADPEAESFYAVMAFSFDGGMTWTAPTRVAEAPRVGSKRREWSIADLNDRFPVRGHTLSLSYAAPPGAEAHARPGDTAGLAVNAAGVFFPLWIDDRTGIEQAWTAPVTASGKVTVRCEVTDQVQVYLTATKHDSPAPQTSVSAHLVNVSKNRTLRGPVLIEALYQPWNSVTTIVNADNGRDGAGAVWQLSSAAVAPGQSTAPRELSFAYAAGIQPEEAAVSLQVRVLAGADKDGKCGS